MSVKQAIATSPKKPLTWINTLTVLSGPNLTNFPSGALHLQDMTLVFDSMTLEDDSDEALMLRYASDGEAYAFEQLYKRHRGPLYRFILRQCGTQATAEELFQDVWTNLIRARGRYQVKSKFTTLLYRMAHNRVMDFHRRNRTQKNAGFSHNVEDADDTLDPKARCAEDALHDRRRVTHLLTLVEQLPQEQREAFVLHEEAGFSVREIAEVTGVGAETAKSRLRYAISKLRRGLGEDE